MSEHEVGEYCDRAVYRSRQAEAYEYQVPDLAISHAEIAVSWAAEAADASW